MTVAEPASGCASVASMRISVVLPAPFGPRIAKIMPRGTSRSMPSTARTSPKLFTRPRADTASPRESRMRDRFPDAGMSFTPNLLKRAAVCWPRAVA